MNPTTNPSVLNKRSFNGVSAVPRKIRKECTVDSDEVQKCLEEKVTMELMTSTLSSSKKNLVWDDEL